jgi:hypothetical protein
MFDLRKIYTRIILVGILLSQVIPTFGAYLGFAGNWIPYTTGFAVTAVAVLLYIFEQRTVKDRITQYAFFLYWVVAVVHTIALMIFFSDLSNYAEYADLFRWFTIPVFILAGVAYAKKADSPLRGGYVLGLTLIIFTLLLFADFIANGAWSSIQKLYKTRTMGFGRFPGNWNYPYNMSVALFFYILVLGLGWQQMKSWTASFFSALGILICVLLIVIGQSRGSLAALFGTSVLFFAYRLFRVNVTKRFRVNGGVVVPVGVIGGSIILMFAAFGLSFFDLVQQFGRRYLQFANIAAALESSGRGKEIAQMTQYLSEYPTSLLIGFGPMRSVDFWVQNLLLYILRYGVLGFVLYVFLIPGMTVISVYFGSNSRLVSRITMVYFAWVVFVIMNSVSHDIFSHFRFIPLFYFMTGIVLGLRYRKEF